MMFSEILAKVLEKKDLQEEAAKSALDEIMQGKINNSQIAAFLTAMRMKGETIEEIAAFVKVMRKNSIRIKADQEHLIDTAGTGGDESKSFNISTASAFVAAGAGARLAKHGNRAASSKCGSADVLEELGVNIMNDAATAKKQLDKIGITFLFAPYFHPAMKYVAPIRKELGFKTVFNILGPLTNPATAKRQVIGVYDKNLLEKMAEVVKYLGTERTMLVSSDMDEISISSESEIVEVCGGQIKKDIISPEDYGFKRAEISSIRVESKEESASMILSVLEGESGPARDIVLLNGGAAIYVSGIANSIKEGIELAKKSIDSKAAKKKLELLKNYEVKK